MRCAEVETEILDGAPLGQAARAHLDGCEACRGLEQAHAGATALGAADEVPPVLPAPDVEGAVARRRRGRLGLVFGGALAAALLAVGVAGAPDGDPGPGSVTDESGQGLSLLLAQVDGMLEEELDADDFAFRPFGELAAWLSPAEQVSAGAFEFDLNVNEQEEEP